MDSFLTLAFITSSPYPLYNSRFRLWKLSLKLVYRENECYSEFILWKGNLLFWLSEEKSDYKKTKQKVRAIKLKSYARFIYNKS